MSETTTAPPGPGPRLPRHPAEVLLNLIVTLLTPMFLSAAGGDLQFARLAAAETLEAYRADTHSDLVTVAKIVAFGLATLGSLSLSMEDHLPVTQILRLRANANATDRSEHRCRLALEQNRSQQPAAPLPDPEPKIDQAALTAAAAEMQQRTAENLAKFSTPAPTAADRENHYAATWAASAATVAAETAASLSSLPPDERRSAAMWVGVLNDAAKEFMAGKIPPRPAPGNLGALFRGT
jgi:hypothetical protein